MHQQIADIFPKSFSYLVLRIEVLALAIYGSLFSKGFVLFKLLFFWFDLPFVFDCFACLGYVLFSNMDILCNRWYINRMVPYFYFKYKKHSTKLNDLFIAFLRKLMYFFTTYKYCMFSPKLPYNTLWISTKMSKQTLELKTGGSPDAPSGIQFLSLLVGVICAAILLVSCAEFIFLSLYSVYALSFDYCTACPSPIYDLWLCPLYLQSFLKIYCYLMN